jgi:subtilase family serine protease
MSRGRRSGSLRSIGLGLVATATVVGVSLTGSAMASASDTATSHAQLVPVSGGNDPAALPGSRVFGNTPKKTPETVSFVLTEQNLTQLQTSVTHGVTSFLTVSQFAKQYGQTTAHILALEQYLQSFGITTQTYTDDIDVVANGTAGEFDRALDVQQQQVSIPAQAQPAGRQAIPAQVVHAATAAPMLPSDIAAYVTAVLGLSNYSAFASQAQHVNSTVAAQPNSGNSCVKLTGLPSACNTPQTFASNYGLSPLYQDSDLGQGQTVGIVTLAALDPGAPQFFWKNVLGMTNSGRTLTVDNVDGGPGAPSNTAGSGESDLDAEQSGGLAPDANVVVYQAPNTDPGFADAFFTAASQNLAGSVSASWGESETFLTASIAAGTETSAYTTAFDEAFLEMAVQGQSTFASAGDSGAYDATGDLGTTNLSVDTPADSPYLTSSGGTTLPWTGTLSGPGGSATVNVNQQRAWGWDYLWPAFATIDGSTEKQETINTQNDAGGGGGFSAIYNTPTYQQGVSGTNGFSAVPYLTPKKFVTIDGSSLPTRWTFDPNPSTLQGQGSGRAEPDLSADGDPFTGYLLYSPSFAQAGDPVLEGGWGGTSFVGPQLNGSTAVMESMLGHRVGFWNPWLYKFAQEKNSPLIPLQQQGTSNDNLFYSGTPGAIYNPATGLGTPNLAALAVDFGRE